MAEEQITGSNNSSYIPIGRHRRTIIRMTVIICIVVIAIACAVAFTLFRIHSQGRFALREGKNIRLALITTDIELYPAGATIYAPERAGGLAPGVLDNVKKFADVNGIVNLISYDRTKREIRQLTYNTGRYLVTFTSDGTKEYWTVDYLWKILDY